MSIEEYVKQSREKQREAFGYCEIKKDCVHYAEFDRRRYRCDILLNDRIQMPCQVGVCYFYRRK